MAEFTKKFSENCIEFLNQDSKIELTSSTIGKFGEEDCLKYLLRFESKKNKKIHFGKAFFTQNSKNLILYVNRKRYDISNTLSEDDIEYFKSTLESIQEKIKAFRKSLNYDLEQGRHSVWILQIDSAIPKFLITYKGVGEDNLRGEQLNLFSYFLASMSKNSFLNYSDFLKHFNSKKNIETFLSEKTQKVSSKGNVFYKTTIKDLAFFISKENSQGKSTA